MWSNKYIGIPYIDNGRDTAGTDCWGLVRLVYKEELNIELPSFFNDYTVSDIDRISELMNQYEEGWEQLSLPEEKCVVLFKILGKVSHIGVMLNERQFLHTRRNQEASVESLDSPKWNKRLAGFYRYTEKSAAKFTETPLALQTVTLELPEGFTVGNAYDAAYTQEQIPENLKGRIIVLLDGKHVTDNDQVILNGQKLEYRLVPDGDDFGRAILTIAVIIIAVKTGMWVSAPTTAATAGAATGLGMGATAGMIAQTAVMMVGMALVNSIFPIRPLDPVSASSSDSSNPQLLLNGARNEARQYEAIPVVLGTYRYIPPVAAINYVAVEDDISWLRMLTCWGYSPLNITAKKIGATSFDNYLDTDTIESTDEISYRETTSPLYNIYGSDTSQQVPNLELPYTENTTAEIRNTNDPIYRVVPESVTSLAVSLHFPEGLRGMYREGSSAGSVFPVQFDFSVKVRRLNANTLLPVDPSENGWKIPNQSAPASKITLKYAANLYAVNTTLDEGGSYTYYVWTSGYVTNRIYMSASGAILVASGPGYGTLGATTTHVSGVQRPPYYDYEARTYVQGSPSWSDAPTLPSLPDGAKELYRVITYCTSTNTGYIYSGSSYSVANPIVHTTTDYRSANNITGGAISYPETSSPMKALVASCTNNVALSTITYGTSSAPYYLRKDAFTATINFSLDMDNPAPYEVKVQRLTSALFDFDTVSNKPYHYNKAYFYLVTGYNAKSTPVTPPKNTTLTLSAFKIKADKQLNGSIDGISGLVSSICLDYENTTYNISSTALTTISGSPTVTVTNATIIGDLASKIFVGSVLLDHNGFNAVPVTVTNIVQSPTSLVITFNTNATNSTTNYTYTITNTNLWVQRTTNNPASLLRYVLQHPANIQAISNNEVADKIDLAALADWHTFCATNGYTYNAVVVSRRSLLEVMRDICAAGRASPMLVNGKWSVVIDRPKTTLVQHFTPHNSWGFEGTRVLSSLPHALRVNITSAYADYQPKEITVYSYKSKKVTVTTVANSNVVTCSDTTIFRPVGTVYRTNTITVTSGTLIPLDTTISGITNGTTFTLSTGTGVISGTAEVTFNIPYTEDTASIFESIQLPGITNEDIARKHAKFHLAQAILRPETYSLSTDMEHLVCNRGDLVRVTHDTPMWGLYTGRIKDSTSSTTLKLSEELLLEIGVNYTIRIRTATGASVVRNVLPVASTGYYSTILLSSGLSTEERAANNLFMLGTLNSESAEMLVVSIEPSTNLTAKLTLVDYSPEVFSADTKFTSLPSFNANITSPVSFADNFIASTPILVSTAIRSDESVMELYGSSYIYKISIPYKNPSNLEKTVTSVEYRVCLTNDTSKSWRFQGYALISDGSVVLPDVIEGESYSIQLRYVSPEGFSGPWTPEATHTIIGKTTPPGAVTGLVAITEASNIRLNWNKSPEIDIVGYEIRTTNSGWGTAGAVFNGNATTCTTLPAAYGVTTTWYIKAIDAAGLYSTTAGSYSLTIGRPADISNVQYTYSSNSTGQATVTITWTPPTVSATSLASKKYLITFTRPTLGAITTEVSAVNTSLTFNADWEGTATFASVTYDIADNASVGSSSNIVKVAPAVPTAAGSPVVVNGGGVTLNWTSSTPGSLPVAGYQLSTSAVTPTVSPYIFKGNASNINIGTITSGTNTWYLWAYDTAGKYSTTPLTISRTFAGAAAPSVSTPVYADTTAIFKWTKPSSDFEIASYTVTLSASGMTTKSAIMSTTEWEVPVDWVNTTATFTVVAKDIGGLTGAQGSTTLPMVLPSAATVPTFTVKGGGITVGWTSATQGSLPIAGYQLSLTNTLPKTNPYIYKGNASTIDLVSVSYNNTWYLWTFDTMGNYCTTPLTVSKSYTGPLAATISTPVYADTTAIFKWTAPTSDFAIDSYSVTLTAINMTTKTATLSTTEWEVPVDWVNTTATFNIVAKDVAGLIGASANTSLAMDLPSSPTVPTFTIKGGGITIGWTSATKGSLPIAGYQLSNSSSSPNINPYIYKGSTSSIDIPTIGYTNTWYLFSYDTMGNYCTTPLTVTKNYAGPSAPVFTGIPGTNPKFTFNSAYFKWLPPTTSDFAISYYSLTLAATGMSTLTAKINTTEWEIPVSWSNTTATLTIVPVDVAGLSYTGSSNTLSLTKALPSTPSDPTISEIGTSIDVDWADNTQDISTQLGIVNYEIKDYTNLSLWRGSSSKAQISMMGRVSYIPVNWSRAGTTVTITQNSHGLLTGNIIHIATTSDSAALPVKVYTIIVTDLNTYTVVGLNAGGTSGTASKGYAYSLYAVDYNGEASVVKNFTYTPALPVNISQGTFISDFGNSLTDASLSLIWTGVTPVFGLDYYEVTYDSITIKVSSTSLDIFPLPANWLGNKTFTVKTKDLIGNTSTGTSITVNKQKPSIVPAYSAQVIDNNVMLYWTLPGRTSLPVTSIRVKKGASWNSGTLIGDKSGTFTTIFEQQGGTYTYWMAAVDTDKQESDPISFPVTVSQPPDFIFNGTQTSSFTGAPLNSAGVYDKSASLTVSGNTYTDNGGGVNTWKTGRSTIGLPPGNKYYWEATILNNSASNQIILGIATSTATLSNYVGSDASGYGYYGNNGNKYVGGVASGFGATYTKGDVLGFALDNINNTLTIHKNGTQQGVFSVTAAQTWYPAISLYAGTTDVVVINYGADLFGFPVPAGHNGCTSALFNESSVIIPVDTQVPYAGHFTDIRVVTMTVAAGGTGYAVGDTFRLNSGTVRDTNNYSTGRVAAVSSGVVTSVTITQGGAYTVTPTVTAGATLATSGTGTGLTVTLTTTGNWNSPASQVTAGYPVYIQPTLALGYYEEIFDLGTVLASSQVTLTYNGVTIDGVPTITSTMSTSIDNVTYSNPYSSNTMFATNFRYVKVRVTATQSDIGKGLYSLNYLNIRLDSKIINWSGTTTCATSTSGSPNNADGTLTNFGKEFVDVSAISVTPTGVTPTYPVYDFKDVVLSGSYTVVSNVCTVTTTVAHGFSGNAIGQQVRLSFSSGTAPSGIYAITSVSGGTLGVANSYNTSTVFTVAMTTANTSGNVSAYSQGMRLYLFDQTGARTSGTVSWSIRGN